MRDVIGQRRLLERLGARALQGGVSHAYGLSGPRGIGKRTIALRLAQTFNCERAPRVAGGCGACRPCLLIERGGHPDVLEVRRAEDRRDIVIEQIRELQQDLSLRPLEGRVRVAIIDDADDLGEHAEVALLKTLEEPPSHAVLLLLTQAPTRLLETIRSRVQALPFRLVPSSEIADGLAERFGDDARRYAAPAAGRPGVAISLASEDGARAERRRLEGEFYRLVSSGLTDRFAWAADLADDPEPRRRTREIERRLGNWVELLRDSALVSRGVRDRAMRPEREDETARLASTPKVSPRDLVDAALLLEKLRRDIGEWNANPRALLELLALKLPYSAELKGAR